MAMTGRVETNGIGVVERALQFGQVVGAGERGLISRALVFRDIRGIIRVEDLWTVAFPLLHDRRVAELGNEAVLALDGGVRDFAGLLRTEEVPWLAHTFLNKVNDVLRLGEVDECIANVAVV